jgi:hypothetical protein
MIRYSADAHNLIGATPLTDSQGEISFVLTNDTTLTWLWTTNYQMLATSTGNGVVVPGMQWYAAGSYSCTTGYPTSYYHFANWLGDITDARYSGLNGSIIDLPMNTPRTISGAFEANVTAMHGVPESWLAAYGFTDNFDAAAEGDQDNDRMETWKEWRSDTDPTNRLSLLQISSLQITPSLVDATWISGIHRTQLLQRASQPSGPWIDIYTNHPPTGITNSFQMPLSNSNQFFRVVVP